MMVNSANVFLLVMLSGTVQGQCHSVFDEQYHTQLTTRLAKLESNVMEHVNQALSLAVEGLEKRFSDAVGELEKRISHAMGKLEEGLSPGQLEQTLLGKLQMLEEKLSLANEKLQENANASEQTAETITTLVKERSHQLELMMNIPEVYRKGGWTTIQHRFDGSVNFYRNWAAYREGFGTVDGEYWIGLEALYELVHFRAHELLVVLEDFDGAVGHAHYSNFTIGSEAEKYALKSLGRYAGTAGDSLRHHEGAPFSTYERNNSIRSARRCSKKKPGAAWWINPSAHCYYGHLNGPYSRKASVPFAKGLQWRDFRGDSYSLKSTRMLIRPSDPIRPAGAIPNDDVRHELGRE